MRRVAILGAGMAGFGAAYRLHAEGLRATIYDKQDRHGGHAATHVFEGRFIFDDGPHISFTSDERIRALFAESVEHEFETIQAQVNNYWKGHWIKHPAQCNLYGLPSELVVEILRDFVHAERVEPGAIHDYETWLIASFGRTFAQTFPMQYGEKYHTTAASNMSVDWLGPRLYRPKLEEVLRGALSPTTADVHYVSQFRYPTRHGFVSYCDLFLDRAELRLGQRLTGLDPDDRVLSFADGSSQPYDAVISTIPLPALIPMIDGVPANVTNAAARLAYSSCVCVNIVLDHDDISEASWTYVYDQDYLITRISYPYRLSPYTTPPGHGSIQAEIYFSAKYRPIDRRPEDCVEPAIADLRRCGLIRENDRVVFSNAFLIPYANVIFDLERTADLAVVNGYLAEIGIATCGRYGEWGYHWTDESFKSGEAAAQRVLDGAPRPAAA